MGQMYPQHFGSRVIKRLHYLWFREVSCIKYFTSLRRQRKNHFHQIGGSKNIGDFEQLRKDRTGCEPPLSHPTYPTQEEGFEEALFFCGGSRLTRHYCWQILSRKHPLRPQVQNDLPENDGLQKESPFPKG